jgi:hypothetical protein
VRIALIGAWNMTGLHRHALRRLSATHSVVRVYESRSAATRALARRARMRAYAALPAVLEEGRPGVAHTSMQRPRELGPSLVHSYCGFRPARVRANRSSRPAALAAAAERAPSAEPATRARAATQLQAHG